MSRSGAGDGCHTVPHPTLADFEIAVLSMPVLGPSCFAAPYSYLGIYGLQPGQKAYHVCSQQIHPFLQEVSGGKDDLVVRIRAAVDV